MNNKYEKIIGWLAGLIVLGILLWGFMSSMESKAPVVPEPEPVQETPQIQTLEKYLNAPMLSAAETADWKMFSNNSFLIKYPKDFSTKIDHIEYGLDTELKGVTFTIPATLTSGTNLSKDSAVIIVENPYLSESCSAEQLATAMNIPTQSSFVAIGNTNYTIAKGGDAGAGNFYEHIYIAIPGDICRGAVLFIHSTNIGNYDPGTIKEFDKSALLSIFATMAASYDAK